MKKILLIRFSSLGDIAMTVPVVHDLATQYPDLDITMLSREMARPLFERLPGNVHFMAADLSGRHKGLFGLCRLWRDARLNDFDAIADLHDVPRTWWLRTEGCLHRKQTAKIDKGRKGKSALTRPKDKDLRQQATSFERYARVLEQLGFPTKPLFTKLDYADRCETPKPAGATWIGIAPFAKHEAKVYPMEQMESVPTGWHDPLPLWRRSSGTGSDRRPLRPIPQRAGRPQPTRFGGGNRPDGPTRRHAQHGLGQHAPCLLGRDARCLHLGWHASLCRIPGMEPKSKRLRPIGFTLPPVFGIR